MTAEPGGGGPERGAPPPRSTPSLHRRVERLLQSGDMRLIYGMAVPLLIVVGLVIALAISGQTWLVIPLILVVIILTAVVMIGISQMLGDDENDEEDADRPPPEQRG